jgi:formiminotetrahydrofolate cyclodeaminase
MNGVLADLPLNELLARMAARTAAPGGGSALGVTCALAAGLVQMAAGFSSAPQAAEMGARAGELRRLALALAQDELESYGPVLEALALPTSDPARPQLTAAALSSASETPLRLAETGAELAELAAGAARDGSPHLAGDAIAGAVLAEAACRAAVQLVVINLVHSGEDPRRRRAGDLARRAALAREEVLASDT